MLVQYGENYYTKEGVSMGGKVPKQQNKHADEDHSGHLTMNGGQCLRS
jgi:hypothetical protein